MNDNTTPSRDDLADILMDLKHDLGKYLRLPFSMLPAAAAERDLTEALETAVFSTRRGPGGTRGAEEIWRAFLDEVGDSLDGYRKMRDLRSAVCRVLDHGDAHRRGDSLRWADVKGDIARVGSLIGELTSEVLGG